MKAMAGLDLRKLHYCTVLVTCIHDYMGTPCHNEFVTSAEFVIGVPDVQ